MNDGSETLELAAALQWCRDGGMVKAVISYDGQGDSGCVEDIYGVNNIDGVETIDNPAVKEALEEAAMKVVEDRWGGWENNDGAYGTVTIDTTTGDAEFDHWTRIMSEEEENASLNLLGIKAEGV